MRAPLGIRATIEQTHQVGAILATDEDLNLVLRDFLQQQSASMRFEAGGVFVRPPMTLDRAADQETSFFCQAVDNIRQELVAASATGQTQFLAPLHVDGHWIAVTVDFEGTKLKRLNFLDPIDSAASRERLQQRISADFRGFANLDGSLEVKVASSNKQHDGHSCGYYAAQEILSQVQQQDLGQIQPHHQAIITARMPDALGQAMFNAVAIGANLAPPTTFSQLLLERNAQIHSDEVFARALQAKYDATPVNKETEHMLVAEAQGVAAAELSRGGHRAIGLPASPAPTSATPFFMREQKLGKAATPSPIVPGV